MGNNNHDYRQCEVLTTVHCPSNAANRETAMRTRPGNGSPRPPFPMKPLRVLAPGARPARSTASDQLRAVGHAPPCAYLPMTPHSFPISWAMARFSAALGQISHMSNSPAASLRANSACALIISGVVTGTHTRAKHSVQFHTVVRATRFFQRATAPKQTAHSTCSKTLLAHTLQLPPLPRIRVTDKREIRDGDTAQGEHAPSLELQYSSMSSTRMSAMVWLHSAVGSRTAYLMVGRHDSNTFQQHVWNSRVWSSSSTST